jgi:hypothetical protein
MRNNKKTNYITDKRGKKRLQQNTYTTSINLI